MVISQPPGNNPSYYYRTSAYFHLNCSECFQGNTLCSIHTNTDIRVTHRNGAIKHIFTRIRSTEGSSADCSLFILSLHALALHLAVKYYFKSFCMKVSTLALHTSCRLYFPPECQQDRTVTQPILLSENIPNI